MHGLMSIEPLEDPKNYSYQEMVEIYRVSSTHHDKKNTYSRRSKDRIIAKSLPVEQISLKEKVYVTPILFLLITYLFAFVPSASAANTFPLCNYQSSASDLDVTAEEVFLANVPNIKFTITSHSTDRQNVFLLGKLSIDGYINPSDTGIRCLAALAPRDVPVIAYLPLTGPSLPCVLTANSIKFVPLVGIQDNAIWVVWDTNINNPDCTNPTKKCPPSGQARSFASFNIPAKKVTASSNSPCPGGDIQLTGGPDGLSYSWTGPNGFTSTQQSPIINNADGAKEGVYTLTGSISTCSATATTTAVIKPHPTCDITAPTAVCENTNSLTASVPTFTGATYSWTVTGDGQAVLGADTSTLTWKSTARSTGTVQISVTVTGPGPAPICSCTKSVTIQVNAKPSCVITAPTAVCENTNSLTASVPAFIGATYSWTVTGDGGVVSGADTRTLIWKSNANSTGKVRLLVTVTGPSPTYCACTSYVDIPVQASPTASAGSAQTICADSTVQLAGWASNYQTVTWSGGSAASFSDVHALNAVYTPTAGDIAAGSVTLTLTATSKAPCATPATSNVVVTIKAKPLCLITAPTSVCESSSGLQASVPIFSGATYSWTVTGDGQAVLGADTSTLTWKSNARSTGTTHISVTVTAPTGCSCSSSVDVTANARPSCVVTPTTAVCENTPGLTVAVPITAGATYAWTVTGAGEVAPGSGNAQTLTWNSKAAGTAHISVTVTGPTGCSCTSSVDIIVKGSSANFTATTTSGCSPLTVTFADGAQTFGTTITKWEWDFNGDGTIDRIDTSAPSTFDYIYNTPGIYTVKLTMTTSCGMKTMTKTNYIIVSSQPVVFPGTYGPACVSGGNIALVGFPVGGTWFGDGVSGNIFHPGVAGPGNHILTYQYTSGSSCSSSNATILTVVPLPQTTITVG